MMADSCGIFMCVQARVGRVGRLERKETRCSSGYKNTSAVADIPFVGVGGNFAEGFIS